MNRNSCATVAAQDDAPTSLGSQQQQQHRGRALQHRRWRLVPKICPLIAGVFGLVANAFSICSLVQDWRQYRPTQDLQDAVQGIKNPPWLIAINSICLGCGLISTLVLFLNLSGRLSFVFAQAITVIGWLFSSLVFGVLVIVYALHGPRTQQPGEYIFTEAFYYAIMATGLYFFVSVVMAFVFVGAHKKYYTKKFSLGKMERTLLLQQLGLMIYLLLGALVFSAIEGWKFLDAVFWADFTLLTIGLGGDFTPKTNLGRLLFIPYAVTGITTVGLMVNSIREVLNAAKKGIQVQMLKRQMQRTEVRILRNGASASKKLAKSHPSESQNEYEFKAMRRLQATTSRKCRWMALTFSVIATITLWLISAVIFQVAERANQWTFLISVYFTSGALLTIGYGDFMPTTNSAKPIFVLWTLFAIPILTITISNSADTIIKEFQDFVLLIGSLTILPGQDGLKKVVKSWYLKLTRDRIPVGACVSTRNPANGHQKSSDNGRAGRKELDHIAERDTYFYHHIIPKELCKVLEESRVFPQKKYSYEEWIYYLSLIHIDRQLDHEGNIDGNFGYAEPQESSWLGQASPLLSTNEAEWVLQRLIMVLRKGLETMVSPYESSKFQMSEIEGCSKDVIESKGKEPISH